MRDERSAEEVVMRLLKFVAKKSLLALGYPRLETIHPELGIYEVGAVRARVKETVPACQFFYPVDVIPSKVRRKRRKRVPYFRKEAVDGLLDFLGGFGDGLMQMLQEKPHPCWYGVDPLLSFEEDEPKAFPLVVFSHGLSGTMEMYTQLCSQIASTGCVVVAIEHEEGSASYAERFGSKDNNDGDDGVVIPYRRAGVDFSKVPYTRDWETNFRAPMLEQRVKEVRNICEFFQEQPRQNTTVVHVEGLEQSSLLMEQIVSITDPSNLHLVGHSFGGATQLLAAQTWERERQNESIAKTKASSTSESTAGDTVVLQQMEEDAAATDSFPVPHPLSITVFDAWNFAMPDSVLSKGLGNTKPLDSSSMNPKPLEIVSVLSETWATKGPERKYTLEFLNNCDSSNCNVKAYFCKDSVHQSVSDTEAFVPSFAAQRIGNRGKGEPRHRTIRAMVEEVAQFTSSSCSRSRKKDVEAERGTKYNEQEIERTTEEDSALVPIPLQ